MLALNTLSNNQKQQLRNAFTLIDGESRDSIITKTDLINLYQQLGLPVPLDVQLNGMLKNSEGINFAQFLQTMAEELLVFEDRNTIYNALKLFAEEADYNRVSEELIIDVDRLKDACCSVQLGEIGSGDHRLTRQTFDELVKGFVLEQTDGKKLFLTGKWLDAYID